MPLPTLTRSYPEELRAFWTQTADTSPAPRKRHERLSYDWIITKSGLPWLELFPKQAPHLPS